MPGDIAALRITLPKAADFTTKQFCFGVVNSSGQVAVATRGAACIGVIDDDSSVVGSATSVIVGGVAQVIAGAAVNAGDTVISDANGHAITLASGDNHPVGVALEAASAGNAQISVLILPSLALAP